MRRQVFGVVILAAITACTPMQYVRPDATLAQIEADKRECGELARQEAFHAPYGSGWWRNPFYPWWSSSHIGADPFLWRVNYERDVFDFCLRARGYRLTPLE